MKGKITKQRQFLADVMDTESLADFRAASLEFTLDLARRRRRCRRVQYGLLIAGVAGAVLSAWLVPELRRSAPVSTPRKIASATVPAAPPLTPVDASVKAERVKLVTDEELLALFPNQPVALIGPPGQQRLVFLDQAGPH